ncbi:MAG TPA: branched-chain amino acid ABC transporter permease [Acidimicrobiia bacterium]|nr:branched-chain amino acid ABC transporter permease [Acidimicrobiia bacterium]
MLISTLLSEQKTALVVIPSGIILLAIAPALISDTAQITLITVLMYAILTLSWTMFSGPTGYVSLATAALFGVGIYVSALLRGTMPIEVIVLIGGLTGFVLALAIGVLTLRLRGVYFILFTFGMTALIRNVVQWWETHFTGTVGRHVLGASNDAVYLLVTILFGATLIVTFLVKHSRVGMALQAIGENQDAAAHIGIHVTRIKVLTFAASAVFVGATGAVMATRWRYIDPSIAFNPLLSFLPVVMAIFGGTSKLYGPILGTVVLVLLQDFLITEHPYLYLLLFGLTLVVIVVWLPGGLVVLAQRWLLRVRIQWAKLQMQVRRVRRR